MVDDLLRILNLIKLKLDAFGNIPSDDISEDVGLISSYCDKINLFGINDRIRMFKLHLSSGSYIYHKRDLVLMEIYQQKAYGFIVELNETLDDIGEQLDEIDSLIKRTVKGVKAPGSFLPITILSTDTNELIGDVIKTKEALSRLGNHFITNMDGLELFVSDFHDASQAMELVCLHLRQEYAMYPPFEVIKKGVIKKWNKIMDILFSAVEKAHKKKMGGLFGEYRGGDGIKLIKLG